MPAEENFQVYPSLADLDFPQFLNHLVVDGHKNLQYLNVNMFFLDLLKKPPKYTKRPFSKAKNNFKRTP